MAASRREDVKLCDHKSHDKRDKGQSARKKNSHLTSLHAVGVSKLPNEAPHHSPSRADHINESFDRLTLNAELYACSSMSSYH